MGENNFKRTAVQTLNEIMKKRGIMPQYECIHDGTETGDGIFTFRVTCSEYTSIGSGGSKKDARQVAAMSMLHEIDEFHEPLFDKVNGNNTKENGQISNAVGVLQMLCSRESLPRPEYELIDEAGPNHAKFFTIECRVLTYRERGTGKMKQAAKHDAARKMISILSEYKEIMKTSLKQFEDVTNNVDKCDGNLRSNETVKKTEAKPEQNNNCRIIEAEVIPGKNTNSGRGQTLLQALSNRMKALKSAETAKFQVNETKKFRLPTGNLLFQRKYIARKLSDICDRLKDPGDKITLDSIDEIYLEIQRLLQLLEIVPFQSFVTIDDDKFMLSIYIPTDPPIIDVAVDNNEIDLKIFLYKRVINEFVDLINRY